LSLRLLARLALGSALRLLAFQARSSQLASGVVLLCNLGSELLRQAIAALLARWRCERGEVADLAALLDLEDMKVGEATAEV
jgi:hypothetical protein